MRRRVVVSLHQAQPPVSPLHTHHHHQARQRAQRFGLEYKAPEKAAFFEKGELKRAERMRRDEGAVLLFDRSVA